jgi:hypothetical protein
MTVEGGADVMMATYLTPYSVPATMRQHARHPDPLVRVVDRILPLGGFDGRVKTMPVSFVADDQIAGFVVFVQRSDGRIIAAADSRDVIVATPSGTPTPAN